MESLINIPHFDQGMADVNAKYFTFRARYAYLPPLCHALFTQSVEASTITKYYRYCSHH